MLLVIRVKAVEKFIPLALFEPLVASDLAEMVIENTLVWAVKTSALIGC